MDGSMEGSNVEDCKPGRVALQSTGGLKVYEVGKQGDDDTFGIVQLHSADERTDKKHGRQEKS